MPSGGASVRRMSRPVLWQFKCSHFCEKVRWALDRKGVEYRRVSLYPGWHAGPTLLVSGRRQVPLLRVGGRTLRDSTRILEYLEVEHPEAPLYPAAPEARERAVALESLFDRLGPALRRVHYSLLVPHLDEAAAFFANAAEGASFRLFKLTFAALLGPTMHRFEGFGAEQVRASRAEVEAILRRFDKEVGPGGYLVGDEFGVADLTLASLLSTFIYPSEFPYPLPVPFPEPVVEYRRSLERYEALSWAREIYAKHRPARVQDGLLA
jgi:glutathione S-transferase